MIWLTIAVALGLAADAFAVSVVTSAMLERITGRHIFRLTFHFGLFHTLLPLLGYYAGRSVSQWVAHWDHWLAFGILVVVGSRAVVEGLRPLEHRSPADPTRGWYLVMLSFGTSVDAFAVGISVAWTDINIWLSVAMIGAAAALMTTLGMLIGGYIGARLGHRASAIGGIVLIGIGLKIVLGHLK